MSCAPWNCSRTRCCPPSADRFSAPVRLALPGRAAPSPPHTRRPVPPPKGRAFLFVRAGAPPVAPAPGAASAQRPRTPHPGEADRSARRRPVTRGLLLLLPVLLPVVGVRGDPLLPQHRLLHLLRGRLGQRLHEAQVARDS